MSRTPKELLDEARMAASAGRFEEAARLVRAVLARAPRHQAARKEMRRLEKLVERARANPVTAQEYETVRQRFLDGDVEGAGRGLAPLLARSPDAPSLHNLHGLILNEGGDGSAALQAFRNAVALDPEYAEAWSNLGLALERCGQLAEAEEALRRANALEPGRPEFMHNLGALLVQRDRFAEAETLLRKALEAAPASAAGWYELGKLLIILGEREKARSALGRALELEPGHEGAAVALARLTRFETKEDPVLQCLLDAWESGSSTGEERVRLGKALGRAWEQLGDPDRAFAFYAEANAIHHALIPDGRAALEAGFAAARAYYTPERGAEIAARRPDPVSPVPIFVMGLNRSGTTLLEQMLASHSQVTGGDELPFLGDWVDAHGDDPAGWTEAEIDALRSDYAARLAELGDTPFVTDKMPANFRWLGLARQAFPEAPIIVMDRDPRDVCFSNFKSDFGSTGHYYASDLAEMGWFYLAYRDLLAHWRSVFGDAVRVQSYEALIEDPEAQMRAVLAHCGLDWEPAVLQFESTRRAVKTLSQVQVREGLNRRGIGAWKPFERHLEPLLKVLRDGGAI